MTLCFLFSTCSVVKVLVTGRGARTFEARPSSCADVFLVVLAAAGVKSVPILHLFLVCAPLCPVPQPGGSCSLLCSMPLWQPRTPWLSESHQPSPGPVACLLIHGRYQIKVKDGPKQNFKKAKTDYELEEEIFYCQELMGRP